MKLNPVYKRELTVSSRSIRMALILMAFNGVLAVAALFNMFSVVEQVKVAAEIQYSRFLELYVFVSTVEFVLLMFIMPALTASSISGERERQTLDLMLTTTMKPRDIVLGKLYSALTTMLLLVLAGFPVLSLVFVYGGITVSDMAVLLICYATVALLAGGIGTFFSALLKRSTVATVCTYTAIILTVAGTYALNVFALKMSQNEVNAYMSSMPTVTMQASSGGALYLLLLNPAVTFYTVINEQAGSGSIVTLLERWFGAHGDNAVLNHWTGVSLALQLLVAVLLIAAAIWAVTPAKTSRPKFSQGRAKRADGGKGSRGREEEGGAQC